MTQTLSKRKRIQTSSSSSYNSNCWLAKGEFFRANEQAVSAEACLCETPPPPLWVECTISLLGQSSEEAKIQIWQLGAGFLTLLAHLQLLQFFFQNSFLLCAELSAAVSCWSKLCNSSPIQCKPKQCNVYVPFTRGPPQTLQRAHIHQCFWYHKKCPSLCWEVSQQGLQKIYFDTQRDNMLILLHQSHSYGKFASFHNTNTECYARLKCKCVLQYVICPCA